MKYLLAQIAFKLPDHFDLKKGDLTSALEALIIYRMCRKSLSKSTSVEERAKTWLSIPDFRNDFIAETQKSDRRLLAYMTLSEHPKPAEKPTKRAKTR